MASFDCTEASWSDGLDGQIVQGVSLALCVAYTLELVISLSAAWRFLLERFHERRAVVAAKGQAYQPDNAPMKNQNRRSSDAASSVSSLPAHKKEKGIKLPHKIFGLCGLASGMQVILWAIFADARHHIAVCERNVVFAITLTYTITMATAFHTVAVFFVALRRIISMQARRRVGREKQLLVRIMLAPGYVVSALIPLLILAGALLDIVVVMRILNIAHAVQCLLVVLLTRKAFRRAAETLEGAIALSLKSAGGTDTARISTLRKLRHKLIATGHFLIASTFSVAVAQLATAFSTVLQTSPHAIFWLLFCVGAAICVWNLLCFAVFWPSRAKAKRWQVQRSSLDQTAPGNGSVVLSTKRVSVVDSVVYTPSPKRPSMIDSLDRKGSTSTETPSGVKPELEISNDEVSS